MFRRKDAHTGARFQLKEKLWSIGDDSWILDESGERIFKVNGKALRIRRTLVIESRDGGELYKIQERKLHIKDTMVVETPGGQKAATVKAKLISVPAPDAGGTRGWQRPRDHRQHPGSRV